jgi:hypothetical protein
MKYENPITCNSKDMANQTYGQAKDYMPPIFRHGGIKHLRSNDYVARCFPNILDGIILQNVNLSEDLMIQTLISIINRLYTL